jgi:hypothetical protein
VSLLLYWCSMMMGDYCLSALLNLSSRIGYYRFCGCICTAFSYSKWLPFQYQCTFNQNSILEASLPSSPALAREQQHADLLVSSALIRASRSLRCCASTTALRSSLPLHPRTLWLSNMHSYTKANFWSIKPPLYGDAV